MCGLFSSSSSKTTRIEMLRQEMKDFVDTVHSDRRCHGAVTTFDDSVDPGKMRPRAEAVESRIENTSAGGKTALYDSLVASMAVWQAARIEAGRTHVPALLITVTDGKENASEADLEDVREAIRRFGFHPGNQCYFAIVGVGNASEQQLRDICADGHGVYQHVSDMEAVMKLVFAATVFGVVGEEEYRYIREQAEDKKYMWLKRRFRAVGLSEMDYMLNLDTSGSMSNKV